MDPFVGGAIIGGIGSLLGGGINAWSQASSNAQNLAWSSDLANRQRAESQAMYAQQRADNLADTSTAFDTMYGMSPDEVNKRFEMETNAYKDRLRRWEDAGGYGQYASAGITGKKIIPHPGSPPTRERTVGDMRHQQIETHESELYGRTNRRLQARLNEQREYDHPANQMKRYIEAGLNPNLIYGNAFGTGQVPTMQSINTMDSPPTSRAEHGRGHGVDYRHHPYFFDPAVMVRLFEQAANLRHLDYQNKQVAANTELAKTQSSVAKTQAGLNKARIEEVESTTKHKKAGKLGWLLGDLGADIMQIPNSLINIIKRDVHSVKRGVGGSVRQGLGARRQ